MPVQNIFTVEDRLNEDPQFKEYILQSMANLGQRLAVKGDSITTKTFAFKDLFAISEDVSTNTHIGCIESIDGNIVISLKNKITMESTPSQKLVVRNTGDSLSISTKIELAIPINGVKEYERGGIIISKNNQILLAFVGKDSSGKYIEFLVDTFDKITGTLINGLRVCEIDDKTVLINLTKHINKYDLLIEDFNNTELKTTTSNILSSISEILNNFSNKKQQLQLTDIDQNYWINNYFNFSTTRNIYRCEIESNDLTTIENDIFLSKDNKEHLEILNVYPEINTKLGYFIYDKNVFLPYAKEYYSTAIYTSNELDFKEHILSSLYNAIYNNTYTSNKLWFSINYLFEYYCNSNNDWQIYGSISNLNVKYINEVLGASNINKYIDDSTILAYTSEDYRVSLYDYYVTYDNNDQNVIYAINVIKRYTLPYINSDNMWVVDESSTNITAKAKDIANPNVVIVFNENKGTNLPKILSGTAHQEIFNKLSWEPKTVYIQPLEQINLDDPKTYTEEDLYLLECKVPVCSQYANESDLDQYIAELKNTLLINISSIYCLSVVNDEIIDKYGRYGVITTIWSLNEKTKEFECIQNPYLSNDIKNVALDINSLTNLNNIIAWHIENVELKHPDKYTHRWLVFDNAVKDLKNNVNDFQSYIYPVIMNNTASDFATADYNNNMNLTIKYLDIVNGAPQNNITSASSSYVIRYINSQNLETTSGIYTYINDNSTTKRFYNEFVPKENIPTLNLKEVLVQNQTVINRSNVLSFDNSGQMYYTYFGTSFNEYDKNKTIIGSSTKNINLGFETMVIEDNNLFKKSNEIDIDFENINLNGETSIKDSLTVKNDLKTDHLNWTQRVIDNEIIYYTQFTPVSKILLDESLTENDVVKYYLCPIQFNNYKDIPGLNNETKSVIIAQLEEYYYAIDHYKKNVNENNLKLFVPYFYYSNASLENFIYLYIGEAIFIPNLLLYLRLNDFVSSNTMKNIKISSNRDIIYYNDTPLFLLTNNRFLTDLDVVNYKHDNLGYNYVSFRNYEETIFIGNSLNISYKIYNNELSLTIDEIESGSKFKNLVKIKTIY